MLKDITKLVIEHWYLIPIYIILFLALIGVLNGI